MITAQQARDLSSNSEALVQKEINTINEMITTKCGQGMFNYSHMVDQGVVCSNVVKILVQNGYEVQQITDREIKISWDE